MERSDAFARDRLVGPLVPVGLAAFLSGLPLVWRSLAGAQHVPAGDAWAYERIARTFHESGNIEMVGWNDISLVGMLPVTRAWTALFGFGSMQLHLLGSIVGFVCLLALLDVMHTIGLRDRLVPLLVFGGFAGFVGVTGTYLSDLFSLAGALWAIAFGLRVVARLASGASGRLDVVLTAVSAGAAFYGFSVRQQAGAAAAVVVVLLWREGARRLAVLWCVVFVVLAVPLHLWRSTLENGGEAMLELHPRSAASAVIAWWFTMGLLTAPLAWRLRRRTAHDDGERSFPAPFLAAVCALPVVVLVASTFADALEPLGAGQSVVARCTEYGAIGWLFALGLATAAGWAWFHLLRSFMRSAGREPLWFAVLIASALELASIIVTSAYFARYSLLAGALLVAWMAADTERPSRDPRHDERDADRLAPALDGSGSGERHGSLALAVVLLASSLWYLDTSTASARALVAAGDVVDCAGIDRRNVDGGFVWNGLHFDGIANARMDSDPPDDGLPETEEQTVFFPMRREVVFESGERPAHDRGVTFGPLSSRGVLPIGTARVWITTSDDNARSIERCLDETTSAASTLE